VDVERRDQVRVVVDDEDQAEGAPLGQRGGLGEVGVGDKVEVEVDGGAKRFMTLARFDAPADVRVYRQGGLMQMMVAALT
jgi:hypothetical protein